MLNSNEILDLLRLRDVRAEYVIKPIARAAASMASCVSCSKLASLMISFSALSPDDGDVVDT